MNVADRFETVACVVCGSLVARSAWIRAPRDDHALELNLPGGRSSWVVCEHCGLVYQSPRPGPESVSLLYSGGTYHQQRGGQPNHYIAYSLRRSRPALDWAFKQEILADKTGKAVDIGAGIGGALVDLRSRGWNVTGIEPDPNLVELGRARFDLDLRAGVLDADAFANEDFDLAYSCHVWEHLADPVATSQLAHQLLRAKDGILFIVVPTFRKARTLAWSCFTAPHTYMFTHISLGNVLRQSGFEVVTHRYSAGSDSELWLIARAVATSPVGQYRRERVGAIQIELSLVPLRAPLGLPARLKVHLSTLIADPRDFAERLVRWTRYRSRRARISLFGR